MTRHTIPHHSALFWLITLLFFCCSPILWAGLVPDTGQTKCYDDKTKEIPCPSPGEPFYGQDAQYICNPHSYTDLGNGVVRDNVTGLEWQQYGVQDRSWDKANTYCENLSLGGYSDWRLPTVKEISNLFDSSIPAPGPAINTRYFSGMMTGELWSSTTFAEDDTEHAWPMRFLDGACIPQNQSFLFNVFAVRGGQSSSSFIDNGDGTVTDTATGLMWQQATASNTTNTWEQALAYCENLTLGGYSDWRLPNRNELQSIVDYNRYNPAIDTTFFPDTAASDYWSSTTTADYPSHAWYVDFRFGEVDYGHIKAQSKLFVRAVRGGQCGSAGTSTTTTPSLTPTIAQTPMSGPPGTTFVQWGTGFTPNGTATLHFKKPDGSEYPTASQKIDNIGHFETAYTAPSDMPAGAYTWWGIDNTTEKKSNELSYVITSPTANTTTTANAGTPAIAQAPMSGPPGTTFVQWGTGFTPNSTATLHFKKPEGSEYPTASQSIDSIGHFEIQYTAPMDKPIGIYTWWAVDGPTEIKTNEVSYEITLTTTTTTIDPSQQTIIFNYLPDDTKAIDGSTCGTFPEEAKNAMEYTAEILQHAIKIDVPVKIDVCWAKKYSGKNTLAGSWIWPFQDTEDSLYYTTALANQRAGKDIYPSTPDGYIWFMGDDASKDIYYWETDGKVPKEKYDLVTTTLHEMIHIFGFYTKMNVAYPRVLFFGPIGNNEESSIYDFYLVNSGGERLLDFDTSSWYSSWRLERALTFGRVYFNGDNARKANNGKKVLLDTPAPWAAVASLVHLDASYQNTTDGLMAASSRINLQPFKGNAYHIIGPVIKGILQDIGWSINSQ